jgi:hypothetical protein
MSYVHALTKYHTGYHYRLRSFIIRLAIASAVFPVLSAISVLAIMSTLFYLRCQREARRPQPPASPIPPIPPRFCHAVLVAGGSCRYQVGEEKGVPSSERVHVGPPYIVIPTTSHSPSAQCCWTAVMWVRLNAVGESRERKERKERSMWADRTLKLIWTIRNLCSFAA